MANGRQQGANFEDRVAKDLGGEKHNGLDGDVDARGFRIECKSRMNLRLDSLTELRSFFDQIQRYKEMPKNAAVKFALAFTGTGSYQKGKYWVAIESTEFKRLTDPVSNRMILDELERIRTLLEQKV